MRVVSKALAVTMFLATAGFACAEAAAPRTPAQGRIVLPATAAPSHYDLVVTPDLKAGTFKGEVKIDLTLRATTDRIKLNAAELVFDKATLRGPGSIAGPNAIGIDLDPKEETATLRFAKPLAPGRYQLSIAYGGKINSHAAGLFSLGYDAGGKPAKALFTQFENSDFRRFAPSWDEPNKKATFSFSAVVPADLVAVSNMPISTSEPLAGGLKRVTFATTPKMSTYLMFFGLGDFERVSRNVDGVDIGVVVKRGDTARGAYALDAAEHILRYYNDYFGVKYPLPKLDLVAGPGTSQFFGAMENWGAIFYFERDLLVDPKISTESDRENVYIVVAHEMAHQWFGDLVTMDWWDDLWLNEGFASWMELKATDHAHPEWNVWLGQLGSKQAAMSLDQRAGGHPVIQHISDVLQANQAFDAITYEKGQSVIRMIEAYVGEDTFRAGVRRYIKRHAYGNTVTDDLWRELDGVSPRKITAIAHDFTQQPGVPLIEERPAGSAVALVQSRFGVDASADTPLTWRVPVVTSEGRELVSRDQPGQLAVQSGPTLVNAGQTGYFRTLYTPAEFAKIAGAYGKLASADQLGVFNDTGSLSYAGRQPIGDLLSLIAQMPADADPVVLTAMVDRLSAMKSLERDLPGQAAFKAFGRRALSPLFARIGWDAKPGESDNAAKLRSSLLYTLADLGDEAVIAEAKRRFEAYRADPASLSSSARRTVLDIVAHHADATIWDELHAMAQSAKTELEREEYYDDLAVADDDALTQKALDLAFAAETPETTGPSMIRNVAALRPELAFNFATSHLTELNKRLEPDSRNQYMPGLVMSAHDLAVIEKLKAWAAEHIPASAQGSVVKAESAVRYTVKLRSERVPDIDRWIAAHNR
jgi:aminopeptidase N